VTTLDRALARRMEPRAATPARRLRAIAALSAAGVPVSVLAAPMIPQLNDHELERILEAAVAAGATGAAYTLLRLPHELKALFAGWLAEHAPDRAARVLARLRECRDGRLYASDFGSRMRGTGPYAELLARRFAVACGRLGLETGTTATRPLDVGQFRVPDAPGPQLRLL
jgi:DNA repair photolyase